MNTTLHKCFAGVLSSDYSTPANNLVSQCRRHFGLTIGSLLSNEPPLPEEEAAAKLRATAMG